jgi:hypothetical protein
MQLEVLEKGLLDGHKRSSDICKIFNARDHIENTAKYRQYKIIGICLFPLDGLRKNMDKSCHK